MPDQERVKPRFCKWRRCGARLVKRDDESDAKFEKRDHCDLRCSTKATADKRKKAGTLRSKNSFGYERKKPACDDELRERVADAAKDVMLKEKMMRGALK